MFHVHEENVHPVSALLAESCAEGHRGALGIAVSRILVVEDDPSLRAMLRLIFEFAGYDVAEAAHGRAALDLLGGPELPDIVTTDLMMPVMNGIDFIRRLRSEPRTAAIPIVVVSANARAAEGVTASRRGADAIMGKPFVPADLVKLVQSLHDGKSGRGGGR
jgi:CheY-like chemotaxis protein